MVTCESCSCDLAQAPSETVSCSDGVSAVIDSYYSSSVFYLPSIGKAVWGPMSLEGKEAYFEVNIRRIGRVHRYYYSCHSHRTYLHFHQHLSILSLLGRQPVLLNNPS